MVKQGSESNETARQHRTDKAVDRKVLEILTESYRHARGFMPPQAALPSAYTAAHNFLLAREKYGDDAGGLHTGGVSEEVGEHLDDAMSKLGGLDTSRGH